MDQAVIGGNFAVGPTTQGIKAGNEVACLSVDIGCHQGQEQSTGANRNPCDSRRSRRKPGQVAARHLTGASDPGRRQQGSKQTQQATGGEAGKITCDQHQGTTVELPVTLKASEESR